MTSTSTTTRRRFMRGASRAALCVAVAALAAPMAFAQQAAAKWPTKPIRIVVAGPGGGTADILGRLLADQLAKELGQPVFAEPKPGASGVLAVSDLAQSPHDGHTVLVGVSSLVSDIPHIIKSKVDMARELS